MKATKPLTEMQYNFVTNYIKNGFNAYQAAISAGYSHDYANSTIPRMLEQPNIKPRIEKAMAKAEDKLINHLGLTYEWKAKKLKRVIEEFIPEDKTIKLNASQTKVGLSALAELNKMQGDYAPDKRLSVTVDATKEKLEEIKKQYEEY